MLKKTYQQTLLISFIILLVIIITAGFFWVTKTTKILPQTSQQKLKVATTIFPLYDITRKISGDLIEVVLILPPGANPHTFEPNPSTVKNIQGSRIVFKIGHGLDDWIDKISKINNQRKLITVDKDINLIKEDDQVDPHYFVSLRNTPTIAENILKEIINLDPQNQPSYTKNYQDYVERVKKQDDFWLKKMKTATNKKIVTLHDAWRYLARDYDIEIVGSFEPEGKEITPKRLAKLQISIKQNSIKTIFSEEQLKSNILENFAKDNNLKVLTLYQLENNNYNTDYADNLEQNINLIYNSFHAN